MMQLIYKLSTAIRGGTREALESAVDTNAIRIMSQEIYECETNLTESKHHLAEVVAQKLSLKRQLNAQQASIRTREASIRSSLEQGNEAKAMQQAGELAQQESFLVRQQEQFDKLEEYEHTLLQKLKNTAYVLGQYRSELSMAKATQQAQKSMGKISVHANQHGDAFSRMQESLDRIRQKHEGFDDHLQAMQDIDAQLKGEPDRQQQNQQQAEAVLARFK